MTHSCRVERQLRSSSSLNDTRNSWTFEADGKYHRVKKLARKLQSAEVPLMMARYVDLLAPI